MYSVHWKRTAVDLLTELWIQSDNRSEINDAVEEFACPSTIDVMH